MTDSPVGGRDQYPGPGDGRPGGGHPGHYTDPAYASQAPYGPPYQPPPRPTERLPAYSPYGGDPYATGQYSPQYSQGYGTEPPQQEPKSPRWLWIVAGVAVVTIIGLVIALVIVNSSSQQTVLAPPVQPEPSASAPTTTSRTPTTTSRTPTTRPSTPLLPLPTAPGTTGTTVPGATDSVAYAVGGTGRAINITYVDTGGMVQTEFNVPLPWSKQVSLPQPGEDSASISVINVGRQVSCSISVNGVEVDERIGSGLTICAPAG